MKNEDKQLSWQARWELGRIAEALPKLEAEIKRLENALDESTGVVQQFKPYPVSEVFGKRMESFSTPENAKAEAAKAFEASQPIHAENQLIRASNEKILQRLVQLISNAGLPESVSVRVKRSSTKYKSEHTEWRMALGVHIPVYDHWSDVERQYGNWIRSCDEWRTRLNREEYAAAEAKRRKDEELDREITRRTLSKKYGLGSDADFHEILEKLLDKDKYLSLAYYLEQNRNDWNDGPDSAKMGLRRFAVASETDHEISDDISSHIVEWQGDGRVFRDCKWNYSRLYEMVGDKTLLDDLEMVKERLWT